MKRKSKEKMSEKNLVGIICDKVFHESTKLSACEMRIVLQNAIDTNK